MFFSGITPFQFPKGRRNDIALSNPIRLKNAQAGSKSKRRKKSGR